MLEATSTSASPFPSTVDLAAVKARQQATWSAGDIRPSKTELGVSEPAACSRVVTSFLVSMTNRLSGDG